MKKGWKVLLVIVALSCFAVALSYPIRYGLEDRRTQEVQERLIAMRDAAIESERNLTGETGTQPEAASADAQGSESAGAESVVEAANAEAQGAAGAQGAEAKPVAEAVNAEVQGATGAESAGADDPMIAQSPAEPVEPETIQGAPAVQAAAAQGVDAVQAGESGAAAPRPSAPSGAAAGSEEVTGPEVTPEPIATPVPSPTVNRYERVGALAYPNLEKRTLDVDRILPRYRPIWELNGDLAGWITIPGTEIDYPVVQCEDSEFYLTHDFFGDDNNNGQIILDKLCDPYTPSYNLVISGHNMRSDKMFGTLDEYRSKSYWEAHKIVQFDTLMERKEYVVLAAFYSADYDEDETGFRYYTDIQYRVDADHWLREVRQNQLYDTGIDAEFGDEFLTLTTCNKKKRQDGRFVVICRKIRQGEEIT